MAIRFDHNNNSEEWQMFFEKINNGSPFGVIREEVFFSSQLKQFLEYKRHFIGFVEIVIGPSESLFFVYENGVKCDIQFKKLLVGVSHNTL